MKGGSSMMKGQDRRLLLIDGNYYVLNRKDREDFIMSVAINYQLSMFGKYTIIPSPETITALMNKINQNIGMVFLPNIINSQQIEIPSNRISTIANLGFITQDQQYSITILNDRIDVSYNKIDDTLIRMEDFYDFAIKALSAIIEYSGIVSYRLAMNIQQVCEMKSFPDLKARGKVLLRSASYYDDKEFTEWSLRTNSQVNVEIKKSQEVLNVITDISSGQDITGQKAVVLFHVDINTLSQNQNMRFGRDALEPFVRGAISIATDLIADVERLIKDE